MKVSIGSLSRAFRTAVCRQSPPQIAEFGYRNA